MTSSLRLWLVVVALLAGALLIACGDNGDGEDSEQPTAAATVEEGADEGADEGDGVEAGDEAGDEAFDDVPLPEGANEVLSSTISGMDLPFPVPPNADVDTEQFGEITLKQYEVDGSADGVFEFYRDRQGDWDEAFSISTDELRLLIWTRDDGQRAVWIAIFPIMDTTRLIIAEGRV